MESVKRLGVKLSSLLCHAGWFIVSAQQNLLPSICSAASFYVLKKIAERVGGLLAYAELLREHFFWSTCEQYRRKATDRQLLYLHSTAARKYDSRFKTQAKFQAKSSLNHVKFLRQRAASVCYRAKNPGEAAHPPPPPPPAILHPSDVEARARPRGMMELRPSISSSQMPRGICSWTI